VAIQGLHDREANGAHVPERSLGLAHGLLEVLARLAHGRLEPLVRLPPLLSSFFVGAPSFLVDTPSFGVGTLTIDPHLEPEIP